MKTKEHLNRRYVLNLALLAVILVGAGFWFYRHLYYHDLLWRWNRIVLAGGLSGGIVIVILQPLRLVRSRLKKVFRALGTKMEAWLDSYLEGAWATKVGLGGVALVTLAFAATSSYYLIHDAAAAEDHPGYEVLLLSGQDTLASGTLRGDLRSLGAIHFMRWPLRRYRVEVRSPALFEPAEGKVVRLWNSLHLRIPRQLTHRAAPILHVVPEPGLTQFLAFPNTEAPVVQYDLIVTQGSASDTLRDVRFGSWVLTTDLDLLQERLPGAGTEPVDRAMARLLEGMPEEARERWRSRLATPVPWSPSVLRPGSISLQLRGGTGEAVVDTTLELRAHRPPRVEVLILEVPQ